MRIDAVHPFLARDYWHVLEPLVKKACDRSRGEYTPEQVLDYVLDETWVLWVATGGEDLPLPTAIAATHLEEWPSGRRVCRLCFVAADDMESWPESFKTIQEYAKQEQCESVCINGRGGWQRRMGWKPVSYNYEVAI